MIDKNTEWPDRLTGHKGLASFRQENGNEKMVQESGLMTSNGQDSGVSIDKMVYDNIKRYNQVVFTGAPGTGKTYSVRKYVEEAAGDDCYTFVQFHPSYDYTDFVEGLRPVPGPNGTDNQFVRMDGTFKAFCRKIVGNNFESLRNGKSLLQMVDEISDLKNKQQDKLEDKDRQLLQQYNNILAGNSYYFIIDEINRADLSKVLGELMFGLEESYRGPGNRFPTQYQNLATFVMNEDGIADPIEDDCFKHGFFVPENLHLIGTMNDIDRSVESFDFALRRRFVWVDIKANEIMAASLQSMRDDYRNEQQDSTEALSDRTLLNLSNQIMAMNDAISDANMGLNAAYHIGPAYFKDIVQATDKTVEAVLRDIFSNRIEPILREYTRGRKQEDVELLIKSCQDALKIKTSDE